MYSPLKFHQHIIGNPIDISTPVAFDFPFFPLRKQRGLDILWRTAGCTATAVKLPEVCAEHPGKNGDFPMWSLADQQRKHIDFWDFKWFSGIIIGC
jgi:hypothetical protein